MIKVSVIIPVYNTEKYLGECLASVLTQSLNQIEIILVNDCSTDQSLQVLERYQQRDERIHVVDHEKNKGLPAARNSGISHASGQYLIHLDSDDFWLDDDMLKNLYELAEIDGCDILRFNGYQYERSVRKQRLTNYAELLNARFEDEQSLWTYSGVFLYFFRKRFLDENNLAFYEPISIGEDQIFLSSALPKANAISVVNSEYYGYRVDNDSLMRKAWSIDQFIEEEDSARRVVDNLKETPGAIIEYLTRRINQYWTKQVAPRAFEQLLPNERVRLFEYASSNFEPLDLGVASIVERLDEKAIKTLTYFKEKEYTLFEANFRSSINSSLSRYSNAPFKIWPKATLKHNDYVDKVGYKIPGKIIIHAGTHKTGSTLLQHFLDRNQETLARDDYFYSSTASMWDPNSHLLPFALSNKKHFLDFPILEADVIWSNLIQDYLDSGCKNLVISSEFFSPELYWDELPDLTGLKRLLGDNQVQFVFYLREQGQRLESGYCQLIRSAPRKFSMSFDEYWEVAKGVVDYENLLGVYSDAFGSASITPRLYDRSSLWESDICRDFLSILDIDECDSFHSIDEHVNSRWPLPVILFLQEAQQKYSSALSVKEQDRFNHFIKWQYFDRNNGESDVCEKLLDEEDRSRISSYFSRSNQNIVDKYFSGEEGAFSHKSLEVAKNPVKQPENNERQSSIFRFGEPVLYELLTTAWKKLRTKNKKINTLEKTIAKKNKEIKALKQRHNHSSRQKKNSRNFLGLIRGNQEAENHVGVFNKIGRLNFYWRHIVCSKKFRNIEGIAKYNFKISKSGKSRGISAMLRVKNEEVRITECLKSIVGLFDEIVVINNNSTDNTEALINAFAETDPAGFKVRILSYPYDVSRCGSENTATDENSVRSLAYYYNWCLSQCKCSYVCKWDADMVITADPKRRNEFKRFINTFPPGQDWILGEFPIQAVYIDNSGHKFLSYKEINKEVRVHPNTPAVHYKKAELWERLTPMVQLDKNMLDACYVYEIKDTRCDEFSHWSTASILGDRKITEYRNYMAVKKDQHHSCREKFIKVDEL